MKRHVMGYTEYLLESESSKKKIEYKGRPHSLKGNRVSKDEVNPDLYDAVKEELSKRDLSGVGMEMQKGMQKNDYTFRTLDPVKLMKDDDSDATVWFTFVLFPEVDGKLMDCISAWAWTKKEPNEKISFSVHDMSSHLKGDLESDATLASDIIMGAVKIISGLIDEGATLEEIKEETGHAFSH
jgi:hypothetical protein